MNRGSRGLVEQAALRAPKRRFEPVDRAELIPACAMFGHLGADGEFLDTSLVEHF